MTQICVLHFSQAKIISRSSYPAPVVRINRSGLEVQNLSPTFSSVSPSPCFALRSPPIPNRCQQCETFAESVLRSSSGRVIWCFRSVLMGNRGNLLGRRPGSAIVRRSESKIAPMSMSNLGDCLLARQCFKQHKASSRHLPSQTEPSADVEKQY